MIFTTLRLIEVHTEPQLTVLWLTDMIITVIKCLFYNCLTLTCVLGSSSNLKTGHFTIIIHTPAQQNSCNVCVRIQEWKCKMLKILSKDYNQEYWRTFYFAVSQSDADTWDLWKLISTMRLKMKKGHCTFFIAQYYLFSLNWERNVSLRRKRSKFWVNIAYFCLLRTERKKKSELWDEEKKIWILRF